MKHSKLGLLLASAIAMVTASSASATVLISGLLVFKPGTVTKSLSDPLRTLAFSFLADSPGSVQLSTFQAKLDGTTIPVTPSAITFNPTGFVLSFTDPYTLNFTTGFDWTGGFPPTPWAFGGVSTQIDAAGTVSKAQISVLSVPGIPEPATWGLMLGGFALAGLTLRTSVARRKVNYSA